MKLIMITLVAIVVGLMALACTATPAEPTPNIDATVEAKLSQERAVDATVEARINEAQSSTPTSSPPPTPTPSPTPPPTPTPSPTPAPTPTPSPTPAPTPHPWGSRVTYYGNTVYFLSPVTKSKAEEYLEYLINKQNITYASDKHYQLRQVNRVYEIRNGIYKMAELNYATPDELEAWLLNWRSSDERQRYSEGLVCDIQEEIFEGVATVRRWVENPTNGFDNVVMSVPCRY